jgi:hypothetical protein
LEGHAPVATQGLAARGSWWRELLWAKRFDDAYHRELPEAQLRSFNPNKVSLGELGRVLRNYRAHDWILSPAPFNDPLNRLRQPVDTVQWLAVAERAEVFGVAFWSLVQATGPDGATYQTHGLLDRFGQLTATGTVVQRYLMSPSF